MAGYSLRGGAQQSMYGLAVLVDALVTSEAPVRDRRVAQMVGEPDLL